jgi:transketolase
LRALRGVAVFHPADPIEAAECWELALRRQDGPTLLVVSGCATPVLREEAGENRCARGGYVLAEADGPRRATLLASGAEVAAAMQARAMLAELGIPSAVVSLPCWTLFADADPAYRDTVLGGARRFGIEAQDSFGWERWLGQFGDLIGSDASQEPCTAGPVPEAIVMAVQKRLAAE